MTPEALHIQGTNGHTHSYIKNKVDTIISFESDKPIKFHFLHHEKTKQLEFYSLLLLYLYALFQA